MHVCTCKLVSCLRKLAIGSARATIIYAVSRAYFLVLSALTTVKLLRLTFHISVFPGVLVRSNAETGRKRLDIIVSRKTILFG